MEISRELAIQILKYCHEHKDFYFPFLVVCKEYTPEDDDFVEICPNEWETINDDENYKTFELRENLQNLHQETIELMAKGFLDKISKETKIREYIFYTTDGGTFQPNSGAIDPDVENCQILGWAKGDNSKDAFESLKSEYPWLCDSAFDEVIASELKNEKTYYFSLKDKLQKNEK